MMDDFANDTWYQTYKDKGPQFHLIFPMVVLFIIGITGIVFNSSLIYITVKSRNLRGTYHYLLALIALCDVIFQMGHTVVILICCLICNGLTVFCYVCIWIVLKLKSATSSVKNTQSIFKSLAILVGIVVFGWMFNAILKLMILPAFNFNALQLWYLSQCGGILINLASAVNVPVLYFFR
ncbi:serpentine type 7TM GPCR chemoreceptor srsx domain-containing protein [Ditylenchus destructor]|nr:serpentine type 7TM GPCR chemoreceptor srsx domain-containing protein [Ditylenchus destructor]